MISDERLDRIDDLVTEFLNEEAAFSKVCSLFCYAV
jgi:hypothetical protein